MFASNFDTQNYSYRITLRVNVSGKKYFNTVRVSRNSSRVLWDNLKQQLSVMISNFTQIQLYMWSKSILICNIFHEMSQSNPSDRQIENNASKIK